MVLFTGIGGACFLGIVLETSDLCSVLFGGLVINSDTGVTGTVGIGNNFCCANVNCLFMIYGIFCWYHPFD